MTSSNGQDEVDVVGLAAQPLGQLGQDLPAPDAQEVVLDVGLRQARCHEPRAANVL